MSNEHFQHRGQRGTQIHFPKRAVRLRSLLLPGLNALPDSDGGCIGRNVLNFQTFRFANTQTSATQKGIEQLELPLR